MFYLTRHSTHFILRLYGNRHMVKDHSDSEREKTCCCHMGYVFRLTARVLLYAPYHRQDSTYHGLCYTSCGVLSGTRNCYLKGRLGNVCLMTHSTHFILQIYCVRLFS